MNTPRLTVSVVTWNSAPFLHDLLQSLRKQVFQDFSITVVDNASSDDSIAAVLNYFPQATIVRNKENRGFSAAHNQAIRLSETEYIAIVNPDVVLEPDVFSVLVARLDTLPEIGSIGAKLLKGGDESGIIDAAGLKATKFRQFLNRGEGERDRGQYDDAEEVFGLSGAFVVVRRSALEDVRIGDEYFDEDFFAYKEDVDLAWRLLLAGWKNWYEPRAVVFHHRAVRHETHLDTTSRRRRKPQNINRLSYRNHLFLLMKNIRVRDLFLPLPRVFVYEIGKFFYLLVKEQGTALGLFDVLRNLPPFRKKRAVIQRRAAGRHPELQYWFR